MYFKIKAKPFCVYHCFWRLSQTGFMKSGWVKYCFFNSTFTFYFTSLTSLGFLYFSFTFLTSLSVLTYDISLFLAAQSDWFYGVQVGGTLFFSPNKLFSSHPTCPSSLNPGMMGMKNIHKQKVWWTRSLGALRAPTSSWRPFGPLDFVLRGLRALT